MRPRTQALLISAVQYEIPGPAGNTNTLVSGLNDSDVAVGQYDDSDGTTHGFSRNPSTGTITTIDFPGASNTAASGINNAALLSATITTTT